MTQYVTGGTIAVTNGSPVVTGTLTSFQASLVAEGSILYVKGAAYPIQSVQSDTQLTLKIPYAGTTESGLAYTIGRAEAIQSQTVLNANKTAVLLDNLPVFSQQGKALLQAPDFVAQQAILGFSGTYSFAFDDATAMADPGAGNWRANHATLGSATAIAISALDANGDDQSDFLVSRFLSTSLYKCQIGITEGGVRGQVNATGITDNGDWLLITLDNSSWINAAALALADTDACSFLFVPTGNKGADGTNGAPGSSNVVGTSTTSLTIGTGSKTFTIAQTNRGWGVGARLRASSTAAPSVFMEGVVTAYSGTSLTLSVDLVSGSGTVANWTINLTGQAPDQQFPDLDPLDIVDAVPSLDLNLTGPGGLIGTFTRASTGTYFDGAGLLKTAAIDEPRFEFDPATGEALGLLVEGTSTNYAIYSEQFDNAAWGKLGATVSPNTMVAPDGTLTADTITEDSSSGFHSVQTGNLGLIAKNAHSTFSVYLKAGTQTKVRLQISAYSGNSLYANFDLLAGTVTSAVVGGAAGSATVSIRKCRDGWYHCIISGIPKTTDAAVGVQPSIAFVDDAGSVIYDGDGSAYLYAWGAQMEIGSYASSYILATSSPVTRAADNATVPVAGWYRQGIGTVYFEGDFGDGASMGAWSIDDGTANNRLGLYVNNGTLLQFFGTKNNGAGTDTTYLNMGNQASNRIKAAVAFAEDDVAAAANGAGAVTDNTFDPPLAATRLMIGANYAANTGLNGHAKRLIYWSPRLPNASVVELPA